MAVVIVILASAYVRKVTKKKRAILDLRLEEQRVWVEGDIERLDPNLDIHQQTDLIPYDTKYEVPKENIIIEQVLGSGAFGRVYRGTVMGLGGKERTVVAVKMIKSLTDTQQFSALKSEVKIMIHIGRHINIVNMLGASSTNMATKGELSLIVEYCPLGNILEFMRNHEKSFCNQVNNYDYIDSRIGQYFNAVQAPIGMSKTQAESGLNYINLDLSTLPPLSPNETSLLHPVSPDTPSTPDDSLASPAVDSAGTAFTYETTVSSRRSTLRGSRRNRKYSTTTVDEDDQCLCTLDLHSWVFQIARGMDYLSFKKVLHQDLAARNILLTHNSIVKISDFGLSREIYKNDQYLKKGKGPVPVKWIALEGILHGRFTSQSDVWSLGVVMWEIFTLGKNPYPGVEAGPEFVRRLEGGARLDKPKYATEKIYSMMSKCWREQPDDRPTFSEIQDYLAKTLQDTNKQFYLDVSGPKAEETCGFFLNLPCSYEFDDKNFTLKDIDEVEDDKSSYLMSSTFNTRIIQCNPGYITDELTMDQTNSSKSDFYMDMNKKEKSLNTNDNIES